MVSLNLTGFNLMSGKGFYDPGHCGLDLLTPTSIGIICRHWQTKTPIVVSLSLTGFKLLSGQGFHAPCHFGLLTTKSIGVIYGPWPTKKPTVVSLSFTGFKLLSGQGFYFQGHCDLDIWPTKPLICWVNACIWVMAN